LAQNHTITPGDRIMQKEIEIEINNINRTRKWGWGWSNTPTGEDAWSIELPSKPEYTGTLKQVYGNINSDRTTSTIIV
jgi:hypothetical protein